VARAGLSRLPGGFNCRFLPIPIVGRALQVTGYRIERTDMAAA
jgi:hypothetical protein